MNSEFETSTRALPDNRVTKSQSLWLLLALSFVEGWFHWIIGETSTWIQPFTLLTGVINLVFMVRWFILDAAERPFKLSKNWILFFVLFALLAAPVYFFKTRGWAFWRPTGLAALFLILMGTCAALGAGVAEWLQL